MRIDRLAKLLNVEFSGNEEVSVTRCSDLNTATDGSLCFIAANKYISQALQSQASAIVAPSSIAHQLRCPVLISDNPYLVFAKAIQILHPPESFVAGVDSSACIHADCQLGENVHIGANVVISAPCRIGAGSYIGPNCNLTAETDLGEGAFLTASVTICGPTRAGARLRVHPGVVIGSDGFGLANDQGRWVKIPQLGGVIIGNDVEIGSNTTIDRGALQDTEIEDGVKIDNQVQIAHNVRIGAHTAIAGCVGIAGSAIIGRHCAIGGGAGIQGHIQIADGVQVTGMTKISQSILQAGQYSSGTAAQENQQWLRNALRFKHLDELFKRIRQIESRIRDK